VASRWSVGSSGSIARTNETLFAYAQLLSESTDYVLNEFIDTVLAKDKEFLASRAENSASFVPPPPASQPVRKRRSKRRVEAQPSAAESAVDLRLHSLDARAEK
jgi:hypothetical protein